MLRLLLCSICEGKKKTALDIELPSARRCPILDVPGTERAAGAQCRGILGSLKANVLQGGADVELLRDLRRG
jgi:hypothetical protein